MKKSVLVPIFWALVFFAAGFPAVAVDGVDRTELESAGSGENLRFVSYTGPNAVINTLAQIRKIGSDLGSVIAALEPQTAGTAGSENRYQVIHIVSTPPQEKLDADIFSLGLDAGVDHIRNLRVILAGYLSAAYGYSEQDAQTLAVYITVYNAVYRGNMAAYQGRYNPGVTQYLKPQSAGLSLSYTDWPGATQMVIPLSRLPGALSPVETSIISDKAVVDTLKKEPDLAVETRSAMADLKERESVQAQENAQAAAQSAAQAQQAAAQAQQAAVVAQQAAVVAQQAASSAQQSAVMNPDDGRTQHEAALAQDSAKTVQEEAVKAQQQAIQAREQAAEAAKAANAQQAAADKKLSEAQNERSDIARDMNQVVKQEAASRDLKTVSALKLADARKQFSSIVLVDTETGRVVTESPVNVIRGRTVLNTADGNFAAIAGTPGRNSAVRLVIIDAKTLEIREQSYEIAAEDAALAAGANGMFYTVIENGNKYSLAGYNQALLLQARSDVFVQKETPITVTPEAVIVTDDQGQVRYLRSDTLKPVF